MSRVILFECSPRRVSDGAVVTQRYCYKARGPANFLGAQWEPVVIEPPTFSSGIGFDGREFGSAPSPQAGELRFQLTSRTAGAAALVWKNAAVTIRMASWPAGDGNPADAAFSTILPFVADEFSAEAGVAKVTLVDAGQALRFPSVVTKFGTSGDALLDSADALKDRPSGSVVPQAWGQVLGIPAILVDRANGIYLFANSVATAVAGFYDGGAAFTMGVARASLAALQANIPAAGAVDYCLNAGGKLLARPWDTPNYPFTCDATFGATRAADIASAIVSARTALTFKAGAVAALNGLQGAACGIYVDDDSTPAVLLDRLLAGIGVYWRLTSAGTIDLQRVGFAGAPALTVQTFRGRPNRQRIIAPTWRRALGYARNWRPHSESEIAAIVLAGDLAYADGTTIEALKPAEAGSTSGDNLVPNAAFVTDTTGWTLQGGVARVAGIATDPSSYLQFQPGAVRNAFCDKVILINGAGTLFVSGFGYRVAGVAVTTMEIQLYWFDAVGGAVGTIGTVNLTPAAPTTWQAVEMSVAVPAGAVSVKARLVASVTGGVVNMTISRIATTQSAADVTAQKQIVVTVPALVTYGADSTGTIIGAVTSESIRVARGGASIKLDNGTSYAITPAGGITAATVDNVNGSATKGDIGGITFAGNTGSIEVVVTVGGIAQPKQIIQFVKELAPPASTGGSGSKNASDSSLNQCNSTADTVLSDTLTVTIASGESLYGTAPLDFEIDGTTFANRGASCKWQYFASGVWNDFVAGTYVNSTVSASSGRYSGGEWLDPTPGTIAVTQTKGGLAAGDYNVQLVGKLSGNSRTASFYGTARVEAKV